MTGAEGPGEGAADVVGRVSEEWLAVPRRPGPRGDSDADDVEAGDHLAGGDLAVRAGIHRVVSDVVAAGGAIGFLAVPDRAEVDAWVDSLLDRIAQGRAGMLLCRVDGRIEALGAWIREVPGPQGHTALLTRIMAHPAARGLGRAGGWSPGWSRR